MGSIRIDWLVQGKCDGATVQRAIHVSIEFCRKRLREASDQLLDVTDAHRRGSGISGPITIPERQV